MRIEDVARLAGVSISTVSKIVNGKDQGIHPNTRERVLAIVKEYNYTPYASVKNNWSGKAFLIGFLSSGGPGMEAVLDGVMEAAQKGNYGVLACNSRGDLQQELKNLTMLSRNRIDGVIWERAGADSSPAQNDFVQGSIPVYLAGVTADGPGQPCPIDYARLGYNAAAKLAGFGHKRIACMVDSRLAASPLFLKGYRRCLFERQLQFDEQTCILDENADTDQLFLRSFTGVICIDERGAARLVRNARLRNYSIPKSLSVIALSHGYGPHLPEISLLRLPLREYGAYLCNELIARIEKSATALQVPFDWDVQVESEITIDIPASSRQKTVLVVGSIHMDVLINVDDLPQVGKTVIARSINTIPGGKGLNQAVGVARLGGNATLIGKVGKDYEGADICAMLANQRVERQGVSSHRHADTGKAYISIHADGESSIVIYDGANHHLEPADILANEDLFAGAGFCLLPMELPIKTVEIAADTAKRYGVKTILKPTASRSIRNELYRNIDFFIPNEKEAGILCPHCSTVKEKALYFLEKGVGTVIITLGAKGCYLKNADHEHYFPAAHFKALDATGGADAFISALAVYLNQSHSLPDAIRFATCAAGFCVSRQGTLPALVDRTVLDLYMAEHPQQ